MILELSTFLISFAFLADGSPIQALETAPPSPTSDYMSVYPGEGVFFLDNCPDPTLRRPYDRDLAGLLYSMPTSRPFLLSRHAYLPLAWGSPYYARPLC